MTEPVDPAGEDSAWQPKSPAAAKDPEVGRDVPKAVLDEERFLDAVASRVDESASEMDELRDRVSLWYDETDGVSRQPKPTDQAPASEPPTASKA